MELMHCSLIPLPASYSTLFPLTENPISEGGVWLNSSELWTKVRTKPGRAYGTQVGNNYDDSWAHLSGFNPNHQFEGVVYIDTSKTEATNHEVECLTRWGHTATTIQGYETLWNLEGSIQIFRLNGPFITSPADYEQLGSGSFLIPPETGDHIRVTTTGTGSTVTIQCFINDELLATATDTAGNRWLTGNPGMGFFMSGSGDPERFGFSSVTAMNI